MPVVLSDELNVFQSADARFETAVQKLSLGTRGVYRYMKSPGARNYGIHPSRPRQRASQGSFRRLSGFTFLRSGPGQGRHSLYSGCFARRSAVHWPPG